MFAGFFSEIKKPLPQNCGKGFLWLTFSVLVISLSAPPCGISELYYFYYFVFNPDTLRYRDFNFVIVYLDFSIFFVSITLSFTIML